MFITQGFNVVLVPRLAHAGLALSIGLGAMVNALWLLVGLVRSKTPGSSAGLGLFWAAGAGGQRLAGGVLDGVRSAIPWVALGADKLKRIGLLPSSFLRLPLF